MINKFPIPLSDEYPEYATSYINFAVASGENIIKGLIDSEKSFKNYVLSLPEEKLNYRYAEGKWIIKDIIQHLADTERIISYRLLRTLRHDTTPFSSFEENDYVEAAKASERDIKDIMKEFSTVRKSSIALVRTILRKDLKRLGKNKSGMIFTVNALAHFILGHVLHHEAIIKERYVLVVR